MPRGVGLFILLSLAWTGTAAADYLAGLRAWGKGDFAAAAREFLPAAQAGDPEAQFMMGRLYSLGDGVPQDFTQAWIWFDRAASQGHQMAATARAGMADVLTPAQIAQAQAMAVPAPVPALPVGQAPATIIRPEQPVSGRQVVLVPRQGVVVSAAPKVPARMAAPGATAEGRLMASGDLREQVKAVQTALMETGYYAGPADGGLGPATRQAIRDYQRDSGLPQTGLLSHQMMEQMAASHQGQADQQQAAR